jgi:hypothetical protein
MDTGLIANDPGHNRIEPLDALPNDFPILGVLQLDLGRRLDPAGCVRNLAVGGASVRGLVRNHPIRSGALCRGHFPFVRGRLNEHHAGGGAAFANEEHLGGQFEAESLRGFEVDYQKEFGGLLDWQLRWLCALKNPVYVGRSSSEELCEAIPVAH